VDASKRLVKELQIGRVPYLVVYSEEQIQFEHKGLISREDPGSQLPAADGDSKILEITVTGKYQVK
jgi:hypothetical protein